MTRDVYGPKWAAVSRSIKKRDGWRCRFCRRRARRRGEWWKLWLPRELHAHHLVRTRLRRRDPRGVTACRFCHLVVVHGLDRASPLPLWADTMLAWLLVRAVVLGGVAALVWVVLR